MSWVTAIVVSMASLAALIALVVAPVTAGSVPEPLRPGPCGTLTEKSGGAGEPVRSRERRDHPAGFAGRAPADDSGSGDEGPSPGGV